jgi:hypothetical protein
MGTYIGSEMLTKKIKVKKPKKKPADRLIIKGDPQAALDRLLGKKLR